MEQWKGAGSQKREIAGSLISFIKVAFALDALIGSLVKHKKLSLREIYC